MKNDPGKLNDELLQQFMRGFYGYGNYNSDLWFVGMEEGGCGTAAEVQNRLDTWDKHGREELEDVVEFHHGIGVEEYFKRPPKLQRTWGQLIRIILESEGKNSTTEQCKNSQMSGFARKDSNHCLLELFPLPSPNSRNWLYSQFSGLSCLRDRESYKRYCMDFRIKHLQEKMRCHQPLAVIFYGTSYKDYWTQVAGSHFNQHSRGGFYCTENKCTRFFVIRHPSARGVSNRYFSDMGQILFNTENSHY